MRGRSADISRVVKDCLDAGLLIPETRWVVNRRADLVAKLAELTRDDVLRIWKRAAAEFPHPQIRKSNIAAIVADWEAKANRPRTTTWESSTSGRGSTARSHYRSRRWAWPAPTGSS